MQGTMSAPSHVARLFALGKLWGKVKLFHPYLATRDIDWDAALIGALPKARDAKSAEEYRAAIDAMLAALGDPETYTSIRAARTPAAQAAAIEVSEGDPAPATPFYFRVIDGVVVLACSQIAALNARDGSDALERAAPSLEGELARAKGVILDCRRAGPAGRGDWGRYFAFGNYIQDVLADLADRPLTLGTYRYREHSGFASQTGIYSGSALVVVTPGVLRGRDRFGRCPALAVILNEHTPDYRALWSGLQSAGLATIVLECATGPSR